MQTAAAELDLFSGGRGPACPWDAAGESPRRAAALAEAGWVMKRDQPPDYTGPAAEGALLRLLGSLLFYLEPTPDDCLLPILPPWPSPSITGKLYGQG